MCVCVCVRESKNETIPFTVGSFFVFFLDIPIGSANNNNNNNNNKEKDIQQKKTR